MSPANFGLRGIAAVFSAGAFVALVIACAVFCGGCGASALQRSTTAATVTKVALDVTAGGIEVVCAESELDAHPERLSACERALASHGAARAAWNVWAAALIVAHSEEDENAIAIALQLAGPVFDLYGTIADLLQSLGFEVPALPFIEGEE